MQNSVRQSLIVAICSIAGGMIGGVILISITSKPPAAPQQLEVIMTKQTFPADGGPPVVEGPIALTPTEEAGGRTWKLTDKKDAETP